MKKSETPPPKPVVQPITAENLSFVTSAPVTPVIEVGGRKGPEPTRYGDWEKGGKCVDF